jgi:hypothetical protein
VVGVPRDMKGPILGAAAKKLARSDYRRQQLPMRYPGIHCLWVAISAKSYNRERKGADMSAEQTLTQLK